MQQIRIRVEIDKMVRQFRGCATFCPAMQPRVLGFHLSLLKHLMNSKYLLMLPTRMELGVRNDGFGGMVQIIHGFNRASPAFPESGTEVLHQPNSPRDFQLLCFPSLTESCLVSDKPA